jgi:transposase
MGAPSKADWREERRERAWSLKEQGWPQKDIAVALGMSEEAVSQWLKRGREGGVEALNAHPPKGMTPKLIPEQKAQIPELFAKGAQAYGVHGDVWTASRVGEIIYGTFGVRYHRDHVGQLLREAVWSRQEPIERASQCNEIAIKGWYEKRWPALKKSQRRRTNDRLGRRSGFYLLSRRGYN